jgi:hypothetical protein
MSIPASAIHVRLSVWLHIGYMHFNLPSVLERALLASPLSRHIESSDLRCELQGLIDLAVLLSQAQYGDQLNGGRLLRHLPVATLPVIPIAYGTITFAGS